MFFCRWLISYVISSTYDIGASKRCFAAEEPVQTNRRAGRTAFTSWKRNPFAARKVPGAPLCDFKLKGIVWHDNVPKVMLDDDIIAGVGDRVGRDVVVEITEDSVTLKRGTEKYKIKLEY